MLSGQGSDSAPSPRRLRPVGALLVALLAAVMGGLVAVSSVGAAPTSSPSSPAAQARTNYCSPTGDYCLGLVGSGKTVRFRVTLAAKYFARYRLCVAGPRGPATCRSFPLQKLGPGFESTVRWSKNFPDRGAGTYKVTWYSPYGRLGPTMSFKIAGPPPAPALGTRDNPIPLGSAADLGDGWRANVVSTVADATSLVLAENMFNDPPASGKQFFIARVRAAYTGPGSSRFDGTYRLRAVGAAAVSYSTFNDSCGVIPDRISDAEVFTGGIIEGNVCWQIRSADADSLLMYNDGLSSSEKRIFFRLR